MNRGHCLGYAVDSDLEFSFLRPGHQGSKLHVTSWDPPPDPASGGRLMVRWRQLPGRPFHGAVYGMPGGQMTVETSDAGWFRISPAEPRVEAPAASQPIVREIRLWTTPMLLLSALNGLTPLHAACVEIDGRAIAISAPGGHGKTTLAAALAARGHRLLAEDITICQGSPLTVMAGPDLIRLRRPALGLLNGTNGFEVVHESEERIFLRTGNPESSPVPLKAVVLLKEGDQVTVQQRRDSTRIADLWQLSFHIPTLEDRTRSFSAVTQLADDIPVVDLVRPLGRRSFEQTIQAVESYALDQ